MLNFVYIILFINFLMLIVYCCNDLILVMGLVDGCFKVFVVFKEFCEVLEGVEFWFFKFLM